MWQERFLREKHDSNLTNLEIKSTSIGKMWNQIQSNFSMSEAFSSASIAKPSGSLRSIHVHVGNNPDEEKLMHSAKSASKKLYVLHKNTF